MEQETEQANIDTKTAIAIAKIIAAAPEERLPMILGVFAKANLDIKGLEELEEWKEISRAKNVIFDINEFLACLINNDNIPRTYSENKPDYIDFPVEAFNTYCKASGLSPRSVRRRLYDRGLLESEKDGEKTNYTISAWNPETKRNERYVRITVGLAAFEPIEAMLKR